MGYAPVETIAHKPEKVSQQERVGKGVIQGDFVSSNILASGGCEGELETSVKSKELTYLDVVKKGML